ncbi:hypothetical protein JMJ77_0006107, partial [Colletotrichum scovillei]
MFACLLAYQNCSSWNRQITMHESPRQTETITSPWQMHTCELAFLLASGASMCLVARQSSSLRISARKSHLSSLPSTQTSVQWPRRHRTSRKKSQESLNW